MNYLIHCKEIRKSYGTKEARVEALRGCDLEIKQGELRMLMGPSGSGKTTLISIIAGILTQDSGECIINGISLNQLQDAEKTRFRCNHIGFVFQAFNLVPMLTNEENISIPLILNKVDQKEAIEKAKELLEQVGMKDKIGKYPSDLSGGQQQRIAIARAIIHKPQIIVCDEPTSFLDHETGIKIMQLLRTLIKEYGVTVILVTHDARIMEFADKIDHLDDGRIISPSS